MTYKTLTVIHSLLEQETQRRHDLYKEAADRYSEAFNALNDFENQDFR